MADRVISYQFKGNFTNLQAGLAAGGKSVADFGGKLTALDKNGAKMRAGLTTTGAAAGKMGLLAAAGIGAIVLASANFDKAMSNVQAATHETADNMELLRAAAIKAGADTAYSASEAAGAIESLAKAGVSTKDILAGGLSGALNLAAAGGMDVAAAAEAAATAMTQFKLQGKDVPHVADLLAAAAGKAQGEVSDMSMALNQGGLVAAQMGLSIEETTGTLAAFASAGLIGSDAGTSLKTMLLRLANPSKQAAATMENLGIQAYNAQGKFVGMESLAGQLSTAFEGQSQATRDAALATIFGSDAIRAASILYSQGAGGVDDWTNKVNDAGYAAETAATKLDNLAGDFEKLKGSLETALIGADGGSQGALRGMVQNLTSTVNAFNSAPPQIQSSITKILAATALLGGGLWATSKIVNGIASTKEALSQLGVEAGTTSKAMSAIGKGVEFYAMVEGVKLLDNALADLTNARLDTTNLNRNLTALADGRVVDNLGKIGTYIRDINSGMAQAQDKVFGILPGKTQFSEAKDEVEKLDQALAAMVESGSADQAAAAMSQITKMAGEQGISVQETTKWFDQYNLALDNLGSKGTTTTAAVKAATFGLIDVEGAASGAAIATGDFGVAQRQTANDTKAATAAILADVKAMQDHRSATLGAFDAETQFRQAMKDARAQAAKSNAGINGSTDAALANRAALSQLAGAWNNQSNAVKNNNGRFAEARTAFIQTATAMGVPRAAAQALAKQLLEIPKSRVIKVTAETSAAMTALNGIQNFKLRDKYITVHTRNTGGPPNGSADGSTVPKDGGSYGDRYPYLLAPGEEVISNRNGQADRNRGLLKAINAGRLADGGTAGGINFGVGHLQPDWLQNFIHGLDDMSKHQLHGLNAELTVRSKLLSKELERDKAETEREKSRLDMLKQERKALMDAVKGNFTQTAGGNADLLEAARSGQLGGGFMSQVDTFTAAQGNSSMSLEDQVKAYLDSLSPAQLAQLQVQAGIGATQQGGRDAAAFEAALKEAVKNGLDPTGALFQQIASSGNLSFLQAFAGSPDLIAQYQQAQQTANQQIGALGQYAGNASFGQAIKDQSAVLADALKVQHSMNRKLHRAEVQLNALNAKVDHLAKDTGNAVGTAINGVVTHGQHKKKG